MGRTLEVRRAESSDVERVAAAYAAATADEVVNAWITSAGSLPPELFAEQLAAFVARAVREDEVWIAVAGDEVRGVSVWFPVHSIDRFEAEAEETAAAAAEHGLPALERAARLTRLLARKHPRELPHLYLHSIATVPEHRGEGVGAAVLDARLHLAAEAGTPVYLEASTERSSRLYERSGFTAEGERIRLPDGGPELIPMWRRPSAGGR